MSLVATLSLTGFPARAVGKQPMGALDFAVTYVAGVRRARLILYERAIAVGVWLKGLGLRLVDSGMQPIAEDPGPFLTISDAAIEIIDLAPRDRPTIDRSGHGMTVVALTDDDLVMTTADPPLVLILPAGY